MTIIIVHDKRASAIMNVTIICVKRLIRGALPSRVEYNDQILNNGLNNVRLKILRLRVITFWAVKRPIKEKGCLLFTVTLCGHSV